MSEKDQDNISQNDSSDTDDLDSLSTEEKAAFEKIMAEISAATGEAPDTDASETPSQPVSEASSSENTSPSPDENTESAPVSDSDASVDVNSNEADKNPEVIPPEALPDDQQEALDKIMAEIESKRKSEKEKTALETESQADDDPLSDDQEDALNQIMAEIEAKRHSDRTESIDSPEPTTDDEPLAEDQQEALNKIMADIQAKKNRPEVSQQEPDEDPPASSETADNKGDGSNSDNLTIDEFDNELNNLLSSGTDKADAGAEELSLPAAQETPPDQGTESAIQDSQPETDQPVDAEMPMEIREPMLHEVTVDSPDPPSIRSRSQKVLRRLMLGTVMVLAALCLGVMALGGYTGYIKIRQWRQTETDASPSAILSAIEANTQGASKSTGKPHTALEANQVQHIAVKNDGATPGLWIKDLITARKQISSRISEIQSLKEYYRNGIDEDIQKIEPLISQHRPTFDEAMTDKNVDLTVRSVQRRRSYIAKLDVPLTALSAMAEELLFLERRAQLHETLSHGISGLPQIDLQHQINLAIENYNQYSKALSIDDIEVVETDLETIWQEISSRISLKYQRISKQSPLNKAISTEICKGNFERKFMLTDLSPETARCLINWNSKDLYLNGLTELSAEAAQILVQWPGEWLSLNGLRTLSADTAKFLAQWPGKRLSLNGLSILSADTTANLSQWEGEQLEMIGLQAIGSWKNYGTRLFLSENLRRRLDIQ